MRILRSVAVIATTIAVSAALTLSVTNPASAATSTDNNVTASDVAAALADSGGVLAASDTVTSQSDVDSAAVTSVDGTIVDVPKDPSAGVDLSSGNYTVTITTPNANNAGDGKVVASGVVAYPSSDGSATAIQATEDGGLRMLTAIDNADAPTNYTYGVDLPSGGHIELTDDGGAVVIASDSTPLYSIAAPWAHDANGVSVPTSFVTDGSTLTQIVDHQASNFAYPIVADPFWSALGNYLGCILGTGVPIGLAFVIAALPASWPFILRWAYQQSANGDRTIINYIYRVGGACSRFIRG